MLVVHDHKETTNTVLQKTICLERENLAFALRMFFTHQLADVGF